MPTLHDITRTLHAYWDQHAPAGLCTLYPGMTLDTSNLTEWVEIWIDSTGDEVRRHLSPAQAIVSLTVHCFSQNRQDTLKSQSLADISQGILSGKLIPISSPENQQPSALIRTQEAIVRNLTRAHAVDDQLALQHLIVTLSATVTECLPVP